MNKQTRQIAPTGMRAIPGGGFLMGSDQHYPEEAPAHRVRVAPFLMDETTVTNRQYAAFVQATGYVTVAERPLDPALYPNAAPPELPPRSNGHLRIGAARYRPARARGRADAPSPAYAWIVDDDCSATREFDGDRIWPGA